MLLLLLSRFHRFRLCVTPQTAAHQAPRPWDSQGKNPGVGCHFLLQCMKGKRESEVTQSCLTLSEPMDLAHQAPLSMGFSRQEYWSGVPLPSLILVHTFIQMQQNIIQQEKDKHEFEDVQYLWWGIKGMRWDCKEHIGSCNNIGHVQHFQTTDRFILGSHRLWYVHNLQLLNEGREEQRSNEIQLKTMTGLPWRYEGFGSRPLQ